MTTIPPMKSCESDPELVRILAPVLPVRLTITITFTCCEICPGPNLCAAQDLCMRICGECKTPTICRGMSSCTRAAIDLTGAARDPFEEARR